ncbi:hypothetical protein [Rhizobium leguminosarum]|uniref:hypothetical protein n=1 Tax=Rhizobium leguminosarum TaxID=384 RepID=UPI00143F5D74|nr:hypothetical protein [Rhizobium leguminosarum]NKL21218.1 hypothetical protein [Rhizobium leguminosarum bv. viciae]NKL56921.1 hypothetical protein [Rhizobium leguminosarum bv. viciae]
MVENAITDVLNLLEEQQVDEYTVEELLSHALTAHQRGDIDDELYFLRLSNLLNNSDVMVDRTMVERIFLPWRQSGLETCGARRSFWLLMEQLSRRIIRGDNSAEFYVWLDAFVGNAIVYSTDDADEQIVLMLDDRWFSEAMRNRVCLWIFYNAALGKMHVRPVSQRLLKAAANNASLSLGRGGLAEEVRAFRRRNADN